MHWLFSSSLTNYGNVLYLLSFLPVKLVAVSWSLYEGKCIILSEAELVRGRWIELFSEVVLNFFLIVNEPCKSVIFNKLLHKTIILPVSIRVPHIYTCLQQESLQVLVFRARAHLSLRSLLKAQPQQEHRALCHHSGPVLHISGLKVHPSLTKLTLMRLLRLLL